MKDKELHDKKGPRPTVWVKLVKKDVQGWQDLLDKELKNGPRSKEKLIKKVAPEDKDLNEKGPRSKEKLIKKEVSEDKELKKGRRSTAIKKVVMEDMELLNASRSAA